MPIRKIPKNYRNVTGVAASRKAIGEAQFESTLERDFLALLDFSPEVVCYEVQPVRIEWDDETGKLRTYTPDVLVTFESSIGRSPWLYEVKYWADIKKDWDALRGKFRRAIRFAKEQGWRFRLISEIEIRTDYLQNVRFLSPFKHHLYSESQIEVLLERLRFLGHTTPADLMGALSPDAWKQAEWLPVLWQQIAYGKIGAALERELTMNSSIWSFS
ncbi:MAG: TnsA endonuclease N-terminal domain-containing protein [Candidatus Thiodiazotropha sp. (ex Lucinoma kastoroae)]|nr:TnsA endonuclease N-terminal domain-containing protein [Candidatus Thiodiazotropha sp. (ex Lucinoma kastoroae)]